MDKHGGCREPLPRSPTGRRSEKSASQNNVTLYTASDFARTLTSNGAGSDHAWGGNAFVLGGGVNGGRVYGSYPDVALTGPNVVTSRGITLPGRLRG